MSSEAILRFENISKNINRTEILKNINFSTPKKAFPLLTSEGVIKKYLAGVNF